MGGSESVLEQARRHVREGEGHIEHQCAVIARLRRGGHETALAESVLHTLRETLRLMREHLAFEERYS